MSVFLSARYFALTRPVSRCTLSPSKNIYVFRTVRIHYRHCITVDCITNYDVLNAHRVFYALLLYALAVRILPASRVDSSRWFASKIYAYEITHPSYSFIFSISCILTTRIYWICSIILCCFEKTTPTSVMKHEYHTYPRFISFDWILKNKI